MPNGRYGDLRREALAPKDFGAGASRLESLFRCVAISPSRPFAGSLPSSWLLSSNPLDSLNFSNFFAQALKHWAS